MEIVGYTGINMSLFPDDGRKTGSDVLNAVDRQINEANVYRITAICCEEMLRMERESYEDLAVSEDIERVLSRIGWQFVDGQLSFNYGEFCHDKRYRESLGSLHR